MTRSIVADTRRDPRVVGWERFRLSVISLLLQSFQDFLKPLELLAVPCQFPWRNALCALS